MSQSALSATSSRPEVSVPSLFRPTLVDTGKRRKPQVSATVAGTALLSEVQAVPLAIQPCPARSLKALAVFSRAVRAVTLR